MCYAIARELPHRVLYVRATFLFEGPTFRSRSPMHVRFMLFADGPSSSVCIVSIMRLHSLVAISNSADPTYDNPPAATWSSVETNVGIICSCLPCLRPMIARCLPGILSSSPYRYGANSGVQRYSRAPFGGRSVGPVEVLPLESKDSRGSGEGDARIQVVTEVHVSVEKEEGKKKKRDSKSGRIAITERV